MTKALQKDPLTLYRVLLARQDDLQKALLRAEREHLDERAVVLSKALEGVEEALAVTIKRLEAEAAEELEAQSQERFDVPVTPSRPADAEDLSLEEDAEEVELSASEGDEEPPEEDLDGVEVPEDAEGVDVEPENPVAMAAKLRREMGDLAADFLDEYAHALYVKILEFFRTGAMKALDLDGDSAESSLRSILTEQVGTRGVSMVEPFFKEWRSSLMKKVAKDLQIEFEVPPEEPPTPDPEDPNAPSGEPVEPAEGASEPEGTPVEELGPSGDDSKEPEKAASASAEEVIVPATGPISQVILDFKPSGRVTAKMH